MRLGLDLTCGALSRGLNSDRPARIRTEKAQQTAIGETRGPFPG